LKKVINENILKPLQNSESYKECHLLEPPNGIILYGQPGTGKTMFAKAIAKSISCPFINFSIHTIENKMFGESAKILKGLFTLAQKLKPCVIFIDELDGFFSHRNSLDQSFVNGLKTQMLQHLDGIDERDPEVVIIGATNVIDSIDKAIKRRMRLHLKVELPDKKTRKLMFEHHLQNFGNLDFDEAGEESRQCSGSDILEICKSAVHTASIQKDDFKKLDQTILKQTIQHFCNT
jgi:SpoVK/Ycf46/Vps4 family AAA+-type ATPase